MKRRTLMKSGIAATGLSLLAPSTRAEQTKPLPRTPADYEGPFYPVGSRVDDSDDLLAKMTTPRGAILHFSGQIMDTEATPIPNVIVDIWHTDPDSRYDHPRDRNPGSRYEDFAYWGKAETDADGRFAFRTYVPGAYRPRPAHIHYKVWKSGSEILTSQVYFKQLGGAQGASKFKSLSELQVADLVKRSEGEFDAEIRIVI